jgi:hypothetical protein
MPVQLRFLLTALGWTVAVTLAHLSLNTRAFDWDGGKQHTGGQFRVGYLPVT